MVVSNVNKLSTLLKSAFSLGLICYTSLSNSEPLEDDFFEMSLQQLGEIEITSAAKKPKKLSSTASSVFVLNHEDIIRSGVTTIADALRLVPGVQVAKLDANKWAVSIRGFNDIFSNKLLILMDGRSVYSPFFGGAYWDTVDTILEDIERIEVIRGPGGTLWGANAVNGIINIISQHAKDSQGLYLSGLAGNEERGTLSLRYGGQINQDHQYRIFAKAFERDTAENGSDDWRMGRLGFRVDSRLSEKDNLQVQSQAYFGRSGERGQAGFPSLGFPININSDTDVFGAHALIQWKHQFSSDSSIMLQSYYDHTERDHFYVRDIRDTVDLEFQHNFKWLANQELIWGLGYRYIHDDVDPGTVLSMRPSNRSDEIFSIFLQNELPVIEDTLFLTLGTKIEHNSYTDFEIQPSARLLWKINEQHNIWSSIARAVKVPNRLEHNVILERTMNVRILGSSDFDSEVLLAYEFGYRFLQKKFNLDISFYYNDYDKLRSLEADPQPERIHLIIDNELHGEAYGMELSSTWQVNPSLRLIMGYSFTQLQLHLTDLSTDVTEEADEGDTPHHQLTLRSMWQLSHDWQVDSTLRYVDGIKSGRGKAEVDPYVTMDMRIAWDLNSQFEFSLIGQNLFGKHREFRGSTVETQATDVEPSIFFKANARF